MKGVAWFFGTFRYTKRSTGISRNATQLDNLRALVPSFEPFDNEGRLRYYSLKVNTRFGPNHQFQVLTQRDRNREDANSQVSGAPDRGALPCWTISRRVPPRQGQVTMRLTF